ncbi:ECF transporter S component [Bacillus salitolerans]|uniref:ECF transporter S component n=1 Tax=Bacillus salitolerans TaxID=1437434 RepID=A0ABW4LTU8_9BACI
MGSSLLLLIISSILLFLTLIASALFLENSFIWISFLMICLAIVPFFLRFERKKVTSREIVIIAILAAIAALSRVPFAAIPSVQPTTFVIIISGLVFGAESGFLIGATAALVSNMLLGQGPWTPWQMYAWGMIGFFAGVFRNHPFMKKIFGQSIFGIVVGFAFGWFMNLWFIVGFMDSIDWKVILVYFSSSFYFDLRHAISNVVFILLFSKSWEKILTRFKTKYGILV